LKTIIHDKPAPTFSWEIDTKGSGDITVDVGSTNPKKVLMWWATTCNGERRDWRLVNIDSPCTCGIGAKGYCADLKVLWSHTELQEDPNRPGIYVAHQELPEVGWKAFFVDITYGPFSVVE
jgi:hypothetical protein